MSVSAEVANGNSTAGGSVWNVMKIKPVRVVASAGSVVLLMVLAGCEQRQTPETATAAVHSGATATVTAPAPQATTTRGATPTPGPIDWDLPDPLAAEGWREEHTPTGQLAVRVPPGWNWMSSTASHTGTPVDSGKLWNFHDTSTGNRGRAGVPGEGYVEIAIAEFAVPMGESVGVRRAGLVQVALGGRKVTLIVREHEQFWEATTGSIAFIRVEALGNGRHLIVAGEVYLPADDATIAELLTAVAAMRAP